MKRTLEEQWEIVLENSENVERCNPGSGEKEVAIDYYLASIEGLLSIIVEMLKNTKREK